MYPLWGHFFRRRCNFYHFFSQGLDEISYGGRRSRRGSISDTNTYSFASRRGSVSTSVDYAALIAATTAVEANSNTKNEKHVENNSTESGLGNSPKSINLSRQNSTR